MLSLSGDGVGYSGNCIVLLEVNKTSPLGRQIFKKPNLKMYN
jgi:hypothetical protein